MKRPNGKMSTEGMVVTIFMLLLVVFLTTYPEWRCAEKARMMDAYAWDHSLLSTGCMIKETESSPWRDVVSN